MAAGPAPGAAAALGLPPRWERPGAAIDPIQLVAQIQSQLPAQARDLTFWSQSLEALLALFSDERAGVPLVEAPRSGAVSPGGSPGEGEAAAPGAGAAGRGLEIPRAGPSLGGLPP